MSAISDVLRRAILASGKSATQLSRESGVAHPVILRFMSKERDIRLQTAEQVGPLLGDGFQAYPEAVDMAFGPYANYGVIIKEYRNANMI